MTTRIGYNLRMKCLSRSYSAEGQLRVYGIDLPSRMSDPG